MSFYSCSREDNICPGPINHGSALRGLSERACIHTKKVLDACHRRIPLKSILVHLNSQQPSHPPTPLRFLSAVCDGTTTLNDLVIERLPDKPNFARVSAKVNVPVKITYSDTIGDTGSGYCTITVTNDVVMFVPQPSIIPFNIEVFGTVSGAAGNWEGGSDFSLTCCLTVIMKVVVEADILVPTYGFCQPPECFEFNEKMCEESLELPLFPTAIQ